VQSQPVTEPTQAEAEAVVRKPPPRSRGLRLLWWAMVVLMSVLVGLMAAGAFFNFAMKRHAQRLPVYSKIEGFSLTERSGKTVTLADLSGKIWVANFIYTTCPTVCPRLTAKMQDVQSHVLAHEAKLGRDADVRLVSFTVDPENDTPAELARYANEWRADERVWLFLTGSLDDISRAVIEGMKIPFEKRGPETAIEIMHGEKFVLVDRKGQIRAYFDGDADGIEQLKRTLDALLDES